MKTQPWMALTLLLISLCGCGATKDPVIGKWVEVKNGEQSIEFKDDGSVVYDIDAAKMEARVRASQPDYAARFKGQAAKWREQLRNQNAKWNKNGEIYAVSGSFIGVKTSVLYYKLDQDNLTSCNQDGSSTAITLTYTPVKK